MLILCASYQIERRSSCYLVTLAQFVGFIAGYI